MAGDKYYDENTDEDNVYNDEYYDSCEDDDYDITGQDSEYENDLHDDPLLDAPWRPSIRWKQIKIGEAVLEVSSYGQVRPFDSQFMLGIDLCTEGTRFPGTPYRTYTVEVEPHSYKTFFMHDLVYQAFYGKPPHGYEVRHVSSHTQKPRLVYSNRLGCLTIVPKKVDELVLGPV